jgi:hypothetical protein
MNRETFKGDLQLSGFQNVLNRLTGRNRTQVVLQLFLAAFIDRYSYDTGPVSR